MPREPDWTQRAYRNALESAKRRMGAGWDLISAEMRRALVCHEACASIQHIDTENVSGDTARRIIGVCETIFREMPV